VEFIIFVILPSLLCVTIHTLNGNCTEGPKAETKTVIVRNLSYETTEDSLKLLFDDAVTCRLITHDDSGKSKGSVVVFHISEMHVGVWAMMM